MSALIDPSYLSHCVRLSAQKAYEVFGTRDFKMVTQCQWSRVTNDVSADIGNPQKKALFGASSDQEVRNGRYVLTRGQSNQGNILHNLCAVGINPFVAADEAAAGAAQDILDVVNEGGFRLTVSNDVVLELPIGLIATSGGRYIGYDETATGNAEVKGPIMTNGLHPTGVVHHILPTDGFDAELEYDGSRWSGLSMATDFDITAYLLDIVCWK